MSDREAIQGAWRVESCRAYGRDIASGTTHYVFDGDRVKEYDPGKVDGGSWSAFELDPAADPKRITITSEFDRDGETVRRVDRWLYALRGKALRLCWPNVFGQFPDVISDAKHGVVTLARHVGQLPPAKPPSGKLPVDHPELGRLTWDDDLDYWHGGFDFVPGHRVGLSADPGEAGDGAAIAAAAAFVRWLSEADASARAAAAAGLLDTHNDSWNDGEPVTAGEFAARLRLETVVADPDGGGQLYYADGELFWGHVVIVPVGPDRTFGEAHIAG